MNHLNYISRGNGYPVILLHGISASLHDWDALLPDLASSGFQAIAVDLLGHGESDKPEDLEAYNSDHIYTTFEEWLLRLPDRTPFSLVGHSYGGYLGLRFAMSYPDKVRALVMIDPFYDLDQLSPWLQWLNSRPFWGARALQLVPLTFIDFVLGWDPADSARFSPEARWQVAVDYKRASPNVLNIPRTIHSLDSKLNIIQTPSLVIWGEGDLTLKPGSFPRLVSILPRAVGHPISGSGHQPHIGNPGLVNPLILDFLMNHDCDVFTEGGVEGNLANHQIGGMKPSSQTSGGDSDRRHSIA